MLANNFAIFIDTFAIEGENLLERDDIPLHADDLGDRGDFTRAVSHARRLNDQIQC